ncbi:MAG: hypothetical protein HY652_11390 [Acidobacteria bacterium]|nr:hypothetical protein [Acidobacteriota bacterium]
MKRKVVWVLGILTAGAVSGFSQAPRVPREIGRNVDVEHYKIQVELLPENHEIIAQATLRFKLLEDTNQVVFGLHGNLTVSDVTDEKNESLRFLQDDIEAYTVEISFSSKIPAGTVKTLAISYQGIFGRQGGVASLPADPYAYVGEEGIYLLNTARWFPTGKFLFDAATTEIEATVPLGMSVVAPGRAFPVRTEGLREVFTWVSEQEIPLVSLVASQYFPFNHPLGSGVPAAIYTTEKHRDLSPTLATEVDKVFLFYEKRFGAYHFPQLSVVQVPGLSQIHPGSGGLMFLPERAVAERDLIQIARSLAYQWWLNSVGMKGSSDSWISDGFAYYAAALYLEESAGTERFQEAMDDLAVLALKHEKKAPVVSGLELGYESPEYVSIVAGKGAWVLHMLRSLLEEEKFFELIREFAEKNAGQRASISDFEAVAKEKAGKDISWFFAQWLRATGVPEFSVEYMVYRTKSGFRVGGSIKQDLELFRVPLEIRIETKGKPVEKLQWLEGKSTNFTVPLETTPVKIVLDPRGKVLRNSDEIQLKVRIARGRELYEQGDFVEAVKELTEAARTHPRSSMAFFRLGETYYEQFNNASAANAFREALNGDLKPKWVEVWCYVYMGKIYDILGQRQRALAEYQKAINTKDDSFGAQVEAQKYSKIPFIRERQAS